MKWRLFQMAMVSNRLQQSKLASSGTPPSKFTYQLSDGATLYVPLTSLSNARTLPETRGANFTLPATAVASLCRVRDAEGQTQRSWEPWCRWLDLQEGSHKLPPRTSDTTRVLVDPSTLRPSVEELMLEIDPRIGRVQQIVIAGEGEPTLAMDKLVQLLKTIRKSSTTTPIRINTNGIVEDPTPIIQCASDLSIGWSVAAMTEDADLYAKLMDVDPSQHALMQNFVRHAVSASLDIEATAIDRPEVSQEATEQWVKHELHVDCLRWRSYFP